MKKVYLIAVSSALLTILFLAAVLMPASTPTMPVSAQGDGFYPTPTYVPVSDDFEYTVETISVSGDVVEFEEQTIDDFTFSNFTYETNYPRGLVFSTAIDIPDDVTEQISVNLIYRFPAGTQGRAPAEYDDELEQWVAIPFDTGGLPPWMTMSAFWRVAYGNEGVETEPVEVQYVDDTREWFRMESEDVILYWYDFPIEFGDVVAEAFVNVRARFFDTFGGYLPFKPTVVVFPPGDAIGEFQSGGSFNPRTTGFARNDTYAAILRVRGLEIEELREECIWNEPRDLEWQMRFSASVATHEVAHLYQFAFGVRAAAWWTEGQATYLELEMGPVDQRLRNLSEMGVELATLQGGGPSGMVGTAAEDGCTHLGYEMGSSFINWLVNTQGGSEVHAEIVDLVSRNTTLPEAIEMATERSFLDLEREWRAYIGQDPEPFIPPTQAYQFPPTATPFGQE